MKRKTTGLLLALLLVLMTMGLSGCGTGGDEVNIDDVDMGGTGNTITVQQYFASTEYIVMGNDEENGELMEPIEKEITLKDGDNGYMLAVDSLKTVPEGDGRYSTIVSDRYTINDISVEDGLAYVDFSSEGLDGGSIDEVIIIDQIVYTLCNTFEDIGAVRFTVDGSDAETLMGAVDISESFVADYL